MTDNLLDRAKKALEGATPGPWRARFQGIDARRYVDTYSAPVWVRIATAELLYADDTEEQNWSAAGNDKANADLIALAPDLARALIAADRALKIAHLVSDQIEDGGVTDGMRNLLNNELAAFRAIVEKSDD